MLPNATITLHVKSSKEPGAPKQPSFIFLSTLKLNNSHNQCLGPGMYRRRTATLWSTRERYVPLDNSRNNDIRMLLKSKDATNPGQGSVADIKIILHATMLGKGKVADSQKAHDDITKPGRAQRPADVQLN